ncbi:site-specific recombinase, phage integrase family [Streptococcus constellatus subsp. pharyngis SK1060 = CCUG 46377]|uniref:Site-specific recombinase, phage integrase family n=1 Tax=Streptococcus constellatus subsp. pharyngis SK1060 = CCUG 46377 TaxID=1035184 RepID=F9P7U1_STRCV|nr:site-specific recombinase, phage integrase family [Streptococcus constellatus subsp. pharyngis SK1060 = CCUG 46377]
MLHKINTGSVLRFDMTLPELYQEWLDLKIFLAIEVKSQKRNIL